MGQITSLFVHKVMQQVDAALDKRALFDFVGLDADSPIDPRQMVADTAYYALLEKVARADPQAMSLPLRTGASMLCDDYGAFGLAWKSALNLRGSYARAERYARVLTSVSTYRLQMAKEGAYMRLHREGERRLGLRLSNEATIASVVSISRQVSTKDFRPLAVYFKHPPPACIATHEQYFGCPVHFDSEMDGLLVSNDTLLTPNKLGDDSISKFFDTHLETQLAQYQDDVSLDQRVRASISQSLSEGMPTVSAIAGQLGLSGRTLQRRLAYGGQSFQSLVDDARRDLARRLLQQTDYSLAEVAFLTGFSEQSAFNRAFKRWEGQTPRSFRLGNEPASR